MGCGKYGLGHSLSPSSEVSGSTESKSVYSGKRNNLTQALYDKYHENVFICIILFIF